MKKGILLIFLLLLSGCSSQPEPTDFDYFYFDTSINIKVYEQLNEEKITTIDKEIDSLLNDLENRYSTTITTSEISQLNAKGTLEVSDEFLEILNSSIEMCTQTNGIYDPSSGTLINLWSINNKNHMPSSAEVDDALSYVGCENIQISGNQVTIPSGYKLDFGSSIKGYAGDKIEEIIRENGIESALINLGGNVQAVGKKYEQEDFVIGIMKPEVNNLVNENVALMPIDDKAVVTSGINQRFFEVDGKVYHHLIDGNVGYPTDNGLASVTIVTDIGLEADILSTATFLLGLEDGYNLIQSLDGVEAVFVTTDKKIYQTTDLDLEIVSDDYHIEEYVDENK